MVKQAIQIFARLKPTKAKKGQYEIYDGGDGLPSLSFVIPRDVHEGVINNKKETYRFGFQRIFDIHTKQEEIFEHVARPVVDNVLQGYNGTIFAYGQTGSGKTFTITGGAERYADRGIIPRTLSYIFDHYEKNRDMEFTTLISYLEIYNENGYDLLDPKHEAAKLDDLPKVILMEDSEQNIHLKNLSAHPAANEEEALNLLFVGDTNRMIAETPMNQASTRSHCIFTIHVTSRVAGSATIRRSKLHLVDLAGSERVSKTGVNGLLLTEAKYINLSLHYLEQVITALSESRRQHIPYINSMMTSVLRDSLGGNCMTTMIANCSIERSNLEETISTCQFAQRVAMIRNEAILNEELSPKLMIERLKRELQQLKDELAMATGESRTDALTDEEINRCEELVDSYLIDDDPEAVLPVGGDMRKIHVCFRAIKRRYLQQKSTATATSSQQVAPSYREPEEETSSLAGSHYDGKDLHQLKEILLQRDNEISILCKMLRKEKERSSSVGTTRQNMNQSDTSSSNSEVGSFKSVGSDTMQIGDRKWTVSRQQAIQLEHEERNKTKILGILSMGRQQAFEVFRQDYEHGGAIEANKQTYKQLCMEAKQLGEQLAQSKATINKLKSSIKQHQAALALSGDFDLENRQPSDVELNLMRKVEEENIRYKETFSRLRDLKHEIEHMQHLLEMSKVKLMKDFEVWWSEQSDAAAATQGQRDALPNSSPFHSGNAWRTPPATPTTLPAVSGTKSEHRPSSAATVSSRRQSASSIRSSSSTVATPSVHMQSDNLSRPSTNIPLTGDTDTDADIMAFLRARQNVIRQASNRKPLL